MIQSQTRRGELKKALESMLAHLQEVDREVTEQIRVEIEEMRNNGEKPSMELAMLIRVRTDVQAAITNLLGAGA